MNRKLQDYLPEKTYTLIIYWLKKLDIQIKISKPRKSKFGDYRAPFNGEKHRISINRDLNIYAFLLTLMHELAHAKTYLDFGKKVKPHGKEWQLNFAQMMEEIIEQNLLPPDIRFALEQYLTLPSASSCTNVDLHRVLKKYDDTLPGLQFIEELPEEAVFEWRNKQFRKMKKLRKRYKCEELNSGKLYLFSPVAEVRFYK